MPESSHLSRLDRLAWAVIAAVAGVVGISGGFGGFSFVWSSFAAPAAACALLIAATAYYRRHRSEPRISSALGGTAQMIAFMAVGAPLSYLAASTALPLQDHLFDGIDRALGLDWRALLAWMNAHPKIHVAFAAAYTSFAAQVITIVLALAFANKLVELRVFMLALMFSAIVCIAVSAALPAKGVWGYYNLSPSDHSAIAPAVHGKYLAAFSGLRDGSFRSLTALGAEGIITFPSFHAALGVIFILAMWPVLLLRWIGLVLNVMMILSTPVDGGHYFVDVIAGLAIAAVCFAAARQIAHAGNRTAHVAAANAAPSAG